MTALRRLAELTPSGLPVARVLVRAGLARAFGPPPPALGVEAGAGDPGLFGPGSASWQVVAEPAAIVGGVRALLVQLLHPLAMAGVAQHSRFRDDPLQRLHRTSAYVTATTYGSVEQALAAVRAVRAVHREVRGVAPDGRPYAAGDPKLLTWVSIAFTASLLATDRAYAPRPVDARTADRFVAEQALLPALLDPRVDLDALAAEPDALRARSVALPLLDGGTLPRSVAELERCLADFAPELGVGEQGREGLRFLLWPNVPPAVLAGYLPLLAGAVATLDDADRRRLGLPAPGVILRRAQLPTRVLLSGLRLVVGRSPALHLAERRARLVPAELAV